MQTNGCSMEDKKDKQALNYMAHSLTGRLPFVVGAIAVLLIVNTALQYAAGPALHNALPLREPTSTVRIVGDRQNIQHGPNHDLTADVAPGGADAELLCIDKKITCDPQHCNKVSVKYQDCKNTCNACDHLRTSIQIDTGLQVRIVQQLSPCIDLHPSCDSWVKQSKCTKEPSSMLELCQASCGFCLPPSVLAVQDSSSTANSGSTGSTASSQQQQQQLGTIDASFPDGMLLDDCQDDINVCPYLAYAGLCKGETLWITTQCPRSCGKCTPSMSLGSAPHLAEHIDLTQQIVDSSISKDSGSTTAVGSAQPQTPVASSNDDVVLGTPRTSNISLYGSIDSASTAFVAESMQEWPVQACRDYQERCAVWAADGECSKNVDYMMISCKRSCNNCKHYSISKPFQVVQLNSGWAMPSVGFGTAGLGVGTAAAVQYAAMAGYRMIDTAESADWYDEAQVGAGITAANVPRKELFLISKIHPRDLGRNATLAAFKRSLQKLNTKYLDLLLLHYPSCTPGTNCVPHPHKRWQDSWKALEELMSAKLVHSIGVSNFGLSEMQELLNLAHVKPAVLETRSDPFAINHHLINFCLEANITFIGYSTLGTQWIRSPAAVNPIFTNEVIKGVAANHPGKSVAQVVLRWALQRGQVVIPRSSSTAHIADNIQLFDFQLSDQEMHQLNGLDGTWKTGGLPIPVA